MECCKPDKYLYQIVYKKKSLAAYYGASSNVDCYEKSVFRNKISLCRGALLLKTEPDSIRIDFPQLITKTGRYKNIRKYASYIKINLAKKQQNH